MPHPILPGRLDLRELRIGRRLLQHELRDDRRLPKQLRLLHRGRSLLAGLPTGVVLRQHACLQRQDRNLRPAACDPWSHRRALHLERGVRIEPLYP